MFLIPSNTRLRKKRPLFRVIAGAVAICVCMVSSPVSASAFTNRRDYSVAISSTASKYSSGDKIYTIGIPDYKTTVTENDCNYFRVTTETGDWYIAIGENTAAALKKAVSKDKSIYYGTYAGKLESEKAPILDIRDGAIYTYDNKKLTKATDAFAEENKTLKQKKQESQSTAKKADPDVYITSGGTKYHKSRTCSNMRAPKKVKKSYATQNGYTACQKCY